MVNESYPAQKNNPEGMQTGREWGQTNLEEPVLKLKSQHCAHRHFCSKFRKSSLTFD